MGKYDALAATALKLLQAKGRPVTLTRASWATLDPVTQSRTETTVTGAFHGVLLPAGRSAEFRVGSLVGRNLGQIYLSRQGTAMEPSKGDIVEWGGATWTIIDVTHYDPADDGAVLTIATVER